MVFHEPLALITTLQTHLDAVGDLSADAFDRFSQLIPADWIEQALQATGTASLRRRRLPAERLIWLVIGLALFRNEPIWHIVRQLGLALDTEQVVPVPSATVQGRQRLGEAPLAHLFDQLSRAWCHTPLPASGLFQGLRLLAVDGVVWSTQDTAEHREVFGGGRSQHGEGSWPQARAVCLMDVHTHLIRAAAFGAYTTGELSYAHELAAAAPDDSLTIFDRAYYSAAFLLAWQHTGKQRHWLMRAKSPLRYEVIRSLGGGDAWVRLPVSPQARRQHPELPGVLGGPADRLSGRPALPDLVGRSRSLPRRSGGGVLSRTLGDRAGLPGYQADHASQRQRLAQQATRAGATGNLGPADRLQPAALGDTSNRE